MRIVHFRAPRAMSRYVKKSVTILRDQIYEIASFAIYLHGPHHVLLSAPGSDAGSFRLCAGSSLRGVTAESM